MSSIPLPALGIKPPAPGPDPIEQYSRLQAIRDLMQRGQLQQQQLQQEQALEPGRVQLQQEQVKQAALATQQQQTSLASQQAMMKAIQNGELNKFATSSSPDGSGFDAAGAYQHLIQNGVLPEHASQVVSQYQTIGKNGAEMYKSLSEADKNKYQLHLDTHKEAVDALADVKTQDDLDAAKQSIAKIPGLEPEVSQHVAQLQLADIPHFLGQMDLANEVAVHAQKQAEAKSAQQKIIPEGGGMSPDTRQQVQKEVAVARNPDIQAGKVAVAKAEGEARANIEAAQARGSNAALAQVPPHLVAPASQAASKAGQDYAQAKSVSDRLKEVMDDAKNGNVVAYQLIPQEGALQITTSQGVKRINMAEIQNYGGGSLWQRLQGHLGKALTGKSIPDSVLNDMSEMQDIMARGTRAKYENDIDTINQTYGSKFKPVEMKDITPKAPQSTGHKVGDVIVQGGKQFKATKVDSAGKVLAADPQ